MCKKYSQRNIWKYPGIITCEISIEYSAIDMILKYLQNEMYMEYPQADVSLKY